MAARSVLELPADSALAAPPSVPAPFPHRRPWPWPHAALSRAPAREHSQAAAAAYYGRLGAIPCGPCSALRAGLRLRRPASKPQPRPLSPRPAHEQQHAIFMARTTYVLYVLNQGRRRFIYDFSIRYLFRAV